MQNTRYSCQILMKLELSELISEKFLNIKFREKSIQWKPSCYKRMDRPTDMMKLKVAFRSNANERKEILKKQKGWTWSGSIPLRAGVRVGLM
jgi:hypothetical protein